MQRGIPQAPGVAAARHRSVQRPLLTICAVVEGLAGLAFILAPGRSSALLLGRPAGPETSMIGRVTGVALAALGVSCWGAIADNGGAARSGTLRAITLYNAGAGLCLVLFGATGKARGPVVWGAGVLHLGLAGAFAASGTAAVRP